jgi:uncharacterized protein (TIGR00661 family)
MKILYGVQGTGNGHITRARMMQQAFAQLANPESVTIDFLFSGREPDDFFDMECFGDYLYRPGLTFITECGSIKIGKTLFKNNVPAFIRDVFSLPVNDYDLIVSDFEPVTAWAGKLRGKKVIGIGHQYAFFHDIPTASRQLHSAMIMRYFAPAAIGIGLHWHHFNQAILPPIIDHELTARETNGKILVYLPFEDQSQVSALLNRVDSHKFVQYSSELEDGQQGNVALRKACHDGFKDSMARASAVICNAGFELVSECLNLQLPILVKPVSGQMEQQSNAKALEILGYASSMQTLDLEMITGWLTSDRQPPSVHYPDVAKSIVEWLLNDNHIDLVALTKQLWVVPR